MVVESMWFIHCCRWMEHTLSVDVASKIHIIDSLWFGIVHNARTKTHTSKTLDGLFGGVDASNLTFVFFPILHRFVAFTSNYIVVY